MLDSRYSSPDAYRIKTEQDGKYYAAGIPSDYWRVAKPFVYKPYRLYSTSGIIGDIHQSDWYDKLVSGDYFTKPYLVYVFTQDHEPDAMTFAFELAKHAIKHMTIQVDNSSCYKVPHIKEPFAILTNVSDDMTTQRKQDVKDWIRHYESSFRIVTVAGDPFKFVALVQERPHLAFCVTKTTQVQA